MWSLTQSRGRSVSIAGGLVLLVGLGCSSIQVTDSQPYEGGKLPKPGHIIVHDFAVTPEQLPLWSEAARKFAHPTTPRSEHEIEVGRRLGSLVAEELVKEIRLMGMPGVRAARQPLPNLGDIVILGYFTSLDEGDATKRVVIGFGKGAATLTTAAEGYLKTEQGMRELGSGTASSKAGKSPGMVVPAVVAVATANPIGLVVGGAVKAAGEMTGKTTIEGVAKDTAETIGARLRAQFEKQGWVEADPS